MGKLIDRNKLKELQENLRNEDDSNINEYWKEKVERLIENSYLLDECEDEYQSLSDVYMIATQIMEYYIDLNKDIKTNIQKNIEEGKSEEITLEYVKNLENKINNLNYYYKHAYNRLGLYEELIREIKKDIGEDDTEKYKGIIDDIDDMLHLVTGKSED